MMLEIIPCECGAQPRIFFIHNSLLGLRVVGCHDCRITGPARMDTGDAIEAWNNGHRIGPEGGRICKCCSSLEPWKRQPVD